jgi:hypothetical protein
MSAARDIDGELPPGLSYAVRPDVTASAELSALANVYRFVLDCRSNKEAAPASGPDDARKDQNAGTYSHCT